MAVTVANPKLEAVNVMLSVIGEAPVNSLRSGLADAEAAERILDRVNKEVQTEGWHFNTRRKYTLTPDANTKMVVLPSNTLKVVCVSASRGYPLVQRGFRLYNFEKSTYEILDDYTTVETDLVEELDFNVDSDEKNAIPEYARRYVSIRASRVFVSRYLGSTAIYGFTENDEGMARSEMKQAETLIGRHSIFDHHTRGAYTIYESFNRLL